MRYELPRIDFGISHLIEPGFLNLVQRRPKH